MIGVTNEVPIYVNGVLLSRRYITTEAGVAIKTTDVNSIALNVYELTCNGTANYNRTVVEHYDDIELTVSDVISDTVQTDSDNQKFNFQYCVEGAFTKPNTTYCVEYTFEMADSHTVIIAIYATTLS